MEYLQGFEFILNENNTIWKEYYDGLNRDHIVNLSSTTDRELREAHNVEKLYRAHEFDD